MAKYLDPKTDTTFKKVFGEHKDLMISFLNALLPLKPGCEIVEIEYLKDELVPDNPSKKDSIVDVRCTDKEQRQFVVEMQMYWTDAFMKRVLFNTCKAYVRPAKRGMDYDDLKPVYTLCLLNDVAFPELQDEFYHEYVPTHRQHSDHTFEDFDIVFVELPKFRPERLTDKKMTVLWLRFLTEINEQTHDVPSELSADALVSKALTLLEESAYTDAELRAVDKYWDTVSREVTMRNSSHREGLAEGEAIGLKKGRAEGLAEGETKERLKNARNLKQLGIAPETIAQATGLSVEEVEGL